jgi:RNA polymerase sigma-70 factor (ECF subfamily)
MTKQTVRPSADGFERLIEAARSGSKDVLGQLLESWRDYLLLLANQQLDSVLRPKGGASDLVQETFLEAQGGLAQFEGRSEQEWVGWLRTILEHNVANFRRRYEVTQKRNIFRELPLHGGTYRDRLLGIDYVADTQTPSARAVADEEILAVQRALSRLPHQQRWIIEARHQQGFSFAEIGRHLDRSAEAARKLWSRAIRRLADELDSDDERSQVDVRG